MSSSIILEINEVLKRIGIEYDDFYVFGDGSYVFLITNLEEEQKMVLNGVGIRDLGYNIYYSENSSIDINSILHYVEEFYITKEKDSWVNIIYKISELEFICSRNKVPCPFESSIKHLKIVAKWNGKLTKNEHEFTTFILDMYSFIVEGLQNLHNKYKSEDFLKITTAMRHWYSHDTSSWRDKSRTKYYDRLNKFFQNYVGIQWPKNPIDFINCQLKLLEMCNDFLDKLIGDLK